jgi:cell wall assembly regulator SMI1
MDAKEAWGRIESWYAKQGVKNLQLNPPATDAAIAAAEQTMGIVFPSDFKRSLRVHDGQDMGAQRFVFPGIERLASLAAMASQWKEERSYDEVQGESLSDDGWFRLDLYHAKRIPIAGIPHWDGDRGYLDLVPGPAGVSGQILQLTSECDFVVLARSFTDMLVQTVEMLERGELVLDGDQLALASGHWAGHPAETLCVAKGY